MNQEFAVQHIDYDRLIAYWLEETDDVGTENIDMHLLTCDACGAMLDELRKMPAHHLQLRLLALDAQGSREIGRYTFHHGG